MNKPETLSAERGADSVQRPCSAFRVDDHVTLFRWDGMLWSRCVTRKPMRDHDGGDDIPGGSVAWRPLTNNGNRMNRLAYVPSRAEIVARTPNVAAERREAEP